jgi:Xaa-Pro aminopeptidase
MDMKTLGILKRRMALGTLILLALATGLILAQQPYPQPGAQAGQVQIDLQQRTRATLEAANSPALAARRAKLIELSKAHADAIIIIPSQYKGRDGMKDNLNFLYLTGIQEAEAVLVLDPAGSPRETVFRRQGGPPGPRGVMVGPSAAEGAISPQQPPAPVGGLDQGLVEKPSTQLASSLFGMVRAGRAKRVLLPFSDFDFLSRTFGTFNPLSQAEAVLNVDPFLSEMRLTKDADEIAILREAIDLTAEALKEAYRAAEPGMTEVDLAAILRYAFNRRETEDSFLQAASGPNSTNVHFGATSRALMAGDLVVFDVGTWIRGYTSDISRTVPANGRFTKDQRALYALVLEAQKEGCRGLVAGVTFKAVQTAVEDILMAGLEKLGLVTDAASPWQRRLYIQHGFGHGIGLDIHDVWSWHSPRLDKVAMAPGMVVTMEPGLYFPEARFEAFLGTLKGRVGDEELAAFRKKVGPVYARYAGMGVRIEDDVLVTEGGSEVLSSGVPKEIAEIEKLMREMSPHSLMKHP